MILLSLVLLRINMIRRSTRVKNHTIKKKYVILHFWRIEKSFKSKLNNVITISNTESLKHQSRIHMMKFKDTLLVP